jgi:hypothetical protein
MARRFSKGYIGQRAKRRKGRKGRFAPGVKAKC